MPGFEQFAVPGVTPATRFDQFPGAPAVDGTTIVFKGNYTIGDAGQTGVFYRDVADAGAPTQVIASSATRIPNQPDVGGEPGTVTFGSTAPPSAAGGKVVFTGLDIEAAPTLGGVYLADLAPSPTLDPLVSIGDRVPGMAETDVFTTIGEGLSFDGRFVTFWGAWGETEQITLDCPEDGNKDLLAYCNTTYPDGFTADVPVHQGIFIHDTATDTTRAVALSDSSDPEAQFSTFQYWTFSGKPPTDTGGDEGGDESQELPRWRSSAFAAVSGNGADYKVAFKASQPSGTTGIYLAEGPADRPIVSVVDTTTAGPSVDPEAAADTVVTSVGIERDGFRGRYLAVSVGMANADASVSWAGIYLVTVDRLVPVAPAAGADSQAVPVPAAPHAQQQETSMKAHATTTLGRMVMAAALAAAMTMLAACGNDDTTGNQARNRQRQTTAVTTTPAAPGTNGTSTGPGTSAGSSTGTATADAALTPILQRAVQEERHAEATYRNVIAALGAIKPFTNIADSESQHVASLVQLADKHQVDVSTIDPAGEVSPSTKTAACQLGVAAEQADIALYDELLPQVTAWPDVTQVLQNLRAASQDSHLPAFQKCA